MERKQIILGLIVVLVIVFILTQRRENDDGTIAPSTTLSNEAVQSIASVYANTTGTAAFNNINVTGVSTLANAQVSTSNLVPQGTIVAWYPPNGVATTAPPSWALCDGTNNTPDLRGRFILGAGQGTGLTLRTLKDVSGEEMHTLSIDEMPKHTHPLHLGAGCWKNGGCDNRLIPRGVNNGDGSSIWTDDSIDDKNVNYELNKGALKLTTRDFMTSTGGNNPHNTMPPFYVLVYIMKL